MVVYKPVGDDFNVRVQDSVKLNTVVNMNTLVNILVSLLVIETDFRSVLSIILTNIVLPFPGGPYNNKPRAGALRPVNNYN